MNVTGLVHTIRVAKKMTHLAVSSVRVGQRWGHSGSCIEFADLPQLPTNASAYEKWALVALLHCSAVHMLWFSARCCNSVYVQYS